MEFTLQRLLIRPHFDVGMHRIHPGLTEPSTPQVPRSPRHVFYGHLDRWIPLLANLQFI